MNKHLTSYNDTLRKVLDPLIPDGSHIALFDFPDHPNVGDSAIWLGGEAYIRDRSDLTLIYTDSVSSLRQKPVALPEGTVILLNGGGNIGDLYWHHQKLREIVIQTYKKHRIVQLPQSIFFSSDRNKERCAKIFSEHRDLHLLVRDNDSFNQAEQLGADNVILAPDMALYLGPLAKRTNPTYKIVELLRTDKERIPTYGNDGPKSDTLRVDWLEEPWSPTRISSKLNDKLPRVRPYSSRFSYATKKYLYHRLATHRLKRGCALLGRGEFVITDRLHAHIISTLLGIPHIVLDNNYQKISNFRSAWGTGTGFCGTATTLFQARRKIYEDLDQ